MRYYVWFSQIRSHMFIYFIINFIIYCVQDLTFIINHNESIYHAVSIINNSG